MKKVLVISILLLTNLLAINDSSMSKALREGKQYQGNLSKVKKLVNNAPVIEKKMYISDTLMEAVFNKNIDIKIIKYLVSQKPYLIDYRDKFGNTVLHNVAISGNVKVLKYLVSLELNVNTLDKNNNTVLSRAMSAAINGKGLDSLRFILSLENGDKYINRKSIGENITPLMNAASSGNKELVRLLIEHGANINLKDNIGRTALDYLMDKVIVKHGKSEYNPQKDLELVMLLGGNKDSKPSKEPEIIEIDHQVWEYKKRLDRRTRYKYIDAISYCEKLSLDGRIFRLPTSNELDSLASDYKIKSWTINGVDGHYVDPIKTPDLNAWSYWALNESGEIIEYNFIRKTKNIVKERDKKYSKNFVKCIEKNN